MYTGQASLALLRDGVERYGVDSLNGPVTDHGGYVIRTNSVEVSVVVMLGSV